MFDLTILRPLVHTREWAVFEEYLKEDRDKANDAMYDCPIDRVERFRGKLEMIKDILTLKDNVERLCK